MAQLGRYRLLIVAVVFHLVYIYSCFSIYFVSPIVHGMREHSSELGSGTKEAPAKRLVLFVGKCVGWEMGDVRCRGRCYGRCYGRC